MIGRKQVIPGVAAMTLGLALLPAVAPGQQAQTPAATVKIGMVSSLFRDVPPSLVQVMTPPFQSLMREQTGLEGQVVTAGDAQDLGKRLEEKSVQLGVFHGFEFAWAQHRFPELRPLMIAINRHRSVKGILIINKDSTATGVTDLKGQTVSVPRKSREYSLLFLERELAALGVAQKDYFGKVVAHASIEDALDDVYRDKIHAVLVDGIALENYQQVKPGCFARLKVLKESEVFPPAVVAYRSSALDEATLNKFRQGMLTANQNPRGKDLMAMWKLTAFENIPDGFDKLVSNVLKAYPPPVTVLPHAPAKK